MHMGLPVPPYAGNVPQWRLDRAGAAGRCARDKLDGRVNRVPKTPAGPPGPKTILVIARAVRSGAGSGIVAGPWDGACVCVTVQGRKGPAIHDDAVFHGLHSREEAESYWNAAFPGAAVAWLLPGSDMIAARALRGSIPCQCLACICFLGITSRAVAAEAKVGTLECLHASGGHQ